MTPTDPLAPAEVHADEAAAENDKTDFPYTADTVPARSRGSRGRTGVPAVDGAPPAPGASPSAALDELTGSGARVRHGDVALELIDPDPRNPEHRWDTIDEDLAGSIETLGVLTPVLLRPNPDVPQRWLLIAGHRRVVHARHVGLVEIPAVLLPPVDDLGALRRLLTENLHREDLSFTEQARLVQGFLDLGVEEKDLPGELHKSPEWVRSRRAVARLPQPAQKKVDTKQLTLEQVVEIDAFADDEKTYARLLEKADTYDFPWQLATAKETRKKAARMLEHRAFLDRLGVPVVKTGKTVRITGDTLTHEVAGTLGPASDWNVDQLTERDVKALAKKHPDLVALEVKNKHFKLLLPIDPALVQKAQRASKAAATKKAKEEAAAAAHAAALAAAEEKALTAHRLRLGFIFEFIRGERQMPHEQLLRTLDVALAAAWSNIRHYRDGRWNTERDWLVGAGLLTEEAGQAAFDAAWAALPPVPGLVMWVASEVEGCTHPDMITRSYLSAHAWLQGLGTQAAAGYDSAPGWYRLLEDLGYTLSDVERTALATPADAADEAGDH